MAEAFSVSVAEILGQMLRNAQALDALLKRVPTTVDADAVAALADALNQIAATTLQQATGIHALMLRHGHDRRHLPDRRHGDRRYRP